MNYIGYFNSLRNVPYSVTFTVNDGSSTVKEITLSDDPVSIDYQGGGDNMYAPLRTSTAKVNVLTNGQTDLMQELYTGSAKGVKVIVTRLSDGVRVWGGWVTPNSYDSDFTGDIDKFEVSCDDGLTMLGNLKYRSTDKEVKSIKDILLKIIGQSEVYNHVLVHNSFIIDGLTSACPLADLYLPESLFFDQKDDNTQTDDDVAWSCQDALTEICRWLNLCMVGFGDTVYMIDFDAVKSGNGSFVDILVSDGSYTTITLSASCNIAQNTYAGSDNSMEMEGVFKKIKVTDSFYTIDNLLPDFYTYAQNITAAHDPTAETSRDISQGSLAEIVSSLVGNEDTVDGNTNLEALVDKVNGVDNEDGPYYNALFVKYFDNPYFHLYKYLLDSEGNFVDASSVYHQGMCYTDTKSMHGASIVKFDVEAIDKVDPVMLAFLAAIGQQTGADVLNIDGFMAEENISSVNFSNFIMFLNPDAHHITNDHITEYPYLESVASNLPALIGGANVHLIISGSYIFHYFDDDPYPIPEGEVDLSEGRYYMDPKEQYILAKLFWGGKYWNGKTWGTTECTFQIPYMKDSSTNDDRRADATMFKDLEIPNAVTWRMGTTEKGYAISMPDESTLLEGVPILTLYKPFDPDYRGKDGGGVGQHYPHRCVFLKDFKFQAIVGDPSYSDVNSTDTEYTNDTTENDSAVNDFADQTFKVCTYDGKSVNYSSVAYKSDGAYHYVDKVTADGYSERQEERLVRKIITQYQSPAIRLKLTLEGIYTPNTLFSEYITGGSYILDAATLDLANDKSKVEIREIKSI
jgi:hypothetical protein